MINFDQTQNTNNPAASAQVHYWELSSYNSGRLVGRWFTLDGLTQDEHQAEITEWLEGLTEATGELCEEWILGDTEGVPRRFVGEYGLSADVWEYLEAAQNTDPEILAAGITCGLLPSQVADHYAGSADSDEAFGEQYAEETGLLADAPENLRRYFDFAAYGRDLVLNSYHSDNGHYFRAPTR